MDLKKLKKLPGILRNEGLYGIYWRLMVRLNGDPYIKEFQQSYERWYEKNGIHTLDLEQQKDTTKKFKIQPLISIITPTYNTDPTYLSECIQSVIDQTYAKWELILIDDNSPNKELIKILKNFSKKDKRINAITRKTNGHISVASNDGLKVARGEWIALLDHDDLLWPNALFEVVKKINDKPHTQFIYSDEDKIAEDGKTHCDPFFKPDWSPHFLWSCNYITHFSVIRKSLVDYVGGFRTRTDGAQDWDLFLRVIEQAGGFVDHPWNPNCVVQHINTVIYSWRKSETSTASEKHSLTAKSYAYSAQEKALNDYFKTKSGAKVIPTKYLGLYDVRPTISSTPIVSIIIPTHDQVDLLRTCVESIISKTTYPHYEIIVVSNNSTSESIVEYAKIIGQKGRVIELNTTFNFSKLCNVGAHAAKGEVLLFMNNDTEVITANWIEHMLSYTLLPEVGCVGPRLLYPNDRLQNNGLVFTKQIHHEHISAGDFVAPYYRNTHKNLNLGMGTVLTATTRDYSAITGAVLMIEKQKFDTIGCWDERFAVAFNDIDLCLRLQKNRMYTILIPYVELIHRESESIGTPIKARLSQLKKEEQLLFNTWNEKIKEDAFFSKKLFLKSARIFATT